MNVCTCHNLSQFTRGFNVMMQDMVIKKKKNSWMSFDSVQFSRWSPETDSRRRPECDILWGRDVLFTYRESEKRNEITHRERISMTSLLSPAPASWPLPPPPQPLPWLTQHVSAKSICIDLLHSPLSSFLLVVIIMKWIWSEHEWTAVVRKPKCSAEDVPGNFGLYLFKLFYINCSAPAECKSLFFFFFQQASLSSGMHDGMCFMSC